MSNSSNSRPLRRVVRAEPGALDAAHPESMALVLTLECGHRRDWTGETLGYRDIPMVGVRTVALVVAAPLRVFCRGCGRG